MSVRGPIDPGFINESIQVIVGQPLVQVWRGGGQAFDFGKEPSSGEIFYHLKLLDHWRITQGDVVIVGSNDHRGKRRFYDRMSPPREDPTRPGAVVRWRRANQFFDLVDREILRVRKVHFSGSCMLVIHLTKGYVIEGMACGSQSHHLFWHNRRDAVPSIFAFGQEMIQGRAEDASGAS